MEYVYKVKISYSCIATFKTWDDAINFIGYALDGGLHDIEIDKVKVEEVQNEAV